MASDQDLDDVALNARMTEVYGEHWPKIKVILLRIQETTKALRALAT